MMTHTLLCLVRSAPWLVRESGASGICVHEVFAFSDPTECDVMCAAECLSRSMLCSFDHVLLEEHAEDVAIHISWNTTEIIRSGPLGIIPRTEIGPISPHLQVDDTPGSTGKLRLRTNRQLRRGMGLK